MFVGREEGIELKIVKYLHYYSYYIAQSVILIVPLLIAGTLIYWNFNPPSEMINLLLNIWLFLAINALIIMLTTILMYLSFKGDLRYLKRKGKPIESLKGMEQVGSTILTKTISTFLITFLAFVSFVTFYVSIYWNLVPFFYASISLVLITFGLAILLRIPKTPSFMPGGLMEFYTPREYPLILDNLFMDTLEAFLDPISWIKYDDYKQDLEKMVLPKNGEVTRTDIERAFEKIMLLNYMKVRMPGIITDDIVRDEIIEVIDEKYYNYLVKNPYLSFKNIRLLLKSLQSRAPEIVTLVDRLYLVLLDNLEEFKNTDLFVDVTAPRLVKGLCRFGLLVFLFNNSDEFKDKRRPVTVRCVAQGFYPEVSEIHITLDPKENFEIKADKLPIFSEGEEDIVGTLPKVLQIGDAVWFSLVPIDYGKKVIRVEVAENGEVVQGRSVVIIVKRDISGLLRNLSGGGSIIGGLGTVLTKILPFGI